MLSITIETDLTTITVRRPQFTDGVREDIAVFGEAMATALDKSDFLFTLELLASAVTQVEEAQQENSASPRLAARFEFDAAARKLRTIMSGAGPFEGEITLPRGDSGS